MEKGKAGRTLLVITEIPYTMIGANIGKFLNDVAALVETKKTTDIVDISNQSSKEGIRIVLELKKGRGCGEPDQYAVQEDKAGGYLWSQHACRCGRKTGDSKPETSH